jgi:hypothetical protein
MLSQVTAQRAHQYGFVHAVFCKFVIAAIALVFDYGAC